MAWEDTRRVAVTSRRLAHSDDAKSRHDEHSSVRSRLRPRARWLVPASVVGALVLVGGGAGAVLMASRGGDPAPADAADAEPSTTPVGEDGPAPPGGTPASEQVFDTAGRIKYVYTKPTGKESRSSSLSMHVDCSQGSSCRLSDIQGFLPSGARNPVLRLVGPNRWHADGRPPSRKCGSNDFGLPDMDLVLTEQGVRVTVVVQGLETRGACFKSYPRIDATYVGTRT